MQKQDNNHNKPTDQLIDQLKQFGFLEEHIQKAVSLTNNVEIAAEIIVKLTQDGQNADLSMYVGSSGINQTLSSSQKQKQQAMLILKEQEVFVEPIKPKMLFLVNGSLKMGKGKVCAQVGHAVIGAYMQIEEEAAFDERQKNRLDRWEYQGHAKIVVKCPTQEQLLGIKKKFQALKTGVNLFLVQDAGHTQIKAGSKTVLAIGPAFSGQIDPLTQHLKLL